MSGTEHIVKLNHTEVATLRAWLDRPNGACPLGRVNFEAVEGGGIMVRTQPYRYEAPEPRRHRPERKMPGLADIVSQSLITVGQHGAERAQALVNGDEEDVANARIEVVVAQRMAEAAMLINDAVHT